VRDLLLLPFAAVAPGRQLALYPGDPSWLPHRALHPPASFACRPAGRDALDEHTLPIGIPAQVRPGFHAAPSILQPLCNPSPLLHRLSASAAAGCQPAVAGRCICGPGEASNCVVTCMVSVCMCGVASLHRQASNITAPLLSR
jgi:hypothetical protein